ncbi:hypothetical protein BCR37DRAFT_376843 [Protomyces lactucae-debilis]|uniref:HIT-like domain-containing protein n=1 Tax=Protomyces lactucae-debilis TaxID=2754530 RepID=A0A1Y2FQJ8_PROLT|nr:uncharacterized protein BCR37DRAFT_376843 [Protomyces lactucae-debilis]ORY86282.1 hypothetical protein BCR37DRAFT_376843 [Protomyces lactucae-debilis]
MLPRSTRKKTSNAYQELQSHLTVLLDLERCCNMCSSQSPSFSASAETLDPKHFQELLSSPTTMTLSSSRTSCVSLHRAIVFVLTFSPKSMFHLLLIPRDRAILDLHPFEALSTDLLDKTRIYIESLKPLFEKELIRLHNGARSNGLPWADYLKIGVHAVPSMSHVHVHIMTRDYSTTWLKTKKHYNSFAGYGSSCLFCTQADIAATFLSI